MIPIYILIAVGIVAVCYFIFVRNSSNRVQNEAKDDDANRFARLLIGQIKLTEPYKLERGVTQNDVYGSLKEEIDGARKTFLGRIREPEFENFFDDQLIELLADGDKGRMGSGYLF